MPARPSGRGWLPRRGLEPRGAAVRPGPRRRDPGDARGHSPRAPDRGRPVRGPRFAYVQGHPEEPVVVVRVVPEGVDPVERLRPYAPPPPPPPKTSRRWVVVGAIAGGARAHRDLDPAALSDGDEAVDIGTNSVARMNAEDGSLELATRWASVPARARSGSGASGSPSRTAASWLAWTSRTARSSTRSRSAPRQRASRSARLGVGHERGRRHGQPDRPRDQRGQPDDPASAPGHRGSRSATAHCGSPTRSAAELLTGGSGLGRVPARARSPASPPAWRSRPTVCGSRSRRPGSRASTRRT